MKSDLIPFDEALQRLLASVHPVSGVEESETLAAGGRVLADAVLSGINVPAQDTATMDGYAVRCADVSVAGTRLPVSQRIPAGSIGLPLAAGTAARIFTGAPLPAGADAVVMQELCERDGDSVVINHRPASGEAIRRCGRDIAQGQEVLPAGTRLRPQHLGLAASVGLPRLPVFRRVRAATFFTGDELVMPGEPLAPGKIYNSNRFIVRSLLERLGCEVYDLGIVPDRLDDTRAALRKAAEGHDLIITSGGVSVGEEDHVKPAVQAEGSLDLWHIAMKPGKALACGRVGNAAFFGLPGNPVSGFVTFALLVRPYILALQGIAAPAPRALSLPAGFEWSRPDRRREFLRARIGDDGSLQLHPDQSAAALLSCAWAEGFVDLPPMTTVSKGQMLRFLPYSELMD